jgi:type I restriction-modification system DNA methylase subunit
MARLRKSEQNGNGANLGFEEKLWQAADKLRGHMDAAEYKHVVLGLVFLKYISDAFEEHRQKLLATAGADPEDRDEYAADNVFWVPKEARWKGDGGLQAKAKQPTIGKLVDDAMVAIEKENASLKGVLPKDYARPTLDKTRLGELIDLVSTIGLGDNETVNMLAADGLQRPLFAVPPRELIQAFDRAVTPMFDKAEQLYRESLELGRVRDALLPKLLSGEVRVALAQGGRHG